MKLIEIVRNVATSHMPPGTVVEQMINNSWLLFNNEENRFVVDKIIESYDYGKFIKLANSYFHWKPEYFRVVKESE